MKKISKTLLFLIVTVLLVATLVACNTTTQQPSASGNNSSGNDGSNYPTIAVAEYMEGLSSYKNLDINSMLKQALLDYSSNYFNSIIDISFYVGSTDYVEVSVLHDNGNSYSTFALNLTGELFSYFKFAKKNLILSKTNLLGSSKVTSSEREIIAKKINASVEEISNNISNFSALDKRYQQTLIKNGRKCDSQVLNIINSPLFGVMSDVRDDKSFYIISTNGNTVTEYLVKISDANNFMTDDDIRNIFLTGTKDSDYLIASRTINIRLSYSQPALDYSDFTHFHSSNTLSSDEINHFYICIDCGESYAEEKHEYDEQYICTTCGYQHNHTAIEWSSSSENHWHECQGCGATYDVESHSYNIQYKCNTCDYVRGTYYYSADKQYIYFGEYPQSQVKDDGLIFSLGLIAGDRFPSSADSQGWTSYGYNMVLGSARTDFMWYKDIEYLGNRYRGIYFTEYRHIDFASTTSTSTQYTYQYKNGFRINSLYWFKWEPIEWRILSTDNSTALLMSNMILDSQQYYQHSTTRPIRTINGTSIYPNNYQYSDIRTWLNGKFYNAAFNSTAKSLIKNIAVNNSSSTTNYAYNYYSCETTNDNIYLLSYIDLINTSYGFSSKYSAKDSKRILTSTAYALSQGQSGGWILRSPYDTGSSSKIGHTISYVSSIGEVGTMPNYPTYFGIVPALTLRL
ncbi:MAG: hypothetical protein K2M36_00375 [Clostridia bacterium]|nr:hypothetical protein [Clostridia bacterium]